MARSAKNKPPAHSFGARLARVRKERGFTQAELAGKADMVQAVISDYELGKLRPYADIAARLARALDVSTDELLVAKPVSKSNGVHNRRFLRRLKDVDRLPKRDQDALLRTIDAFLSARGP